MCFWCANIVVFQSKLCLFGVHLFVFRCRMLLFGVRTCTFSGAFCFASDCAFAGVICSSFAVQHPAFQGAKKLSCTVFLFVLLIVVLWCATLRSFSGAKIMLFGLQKFEFSGAVCCASDCNGFQIIRCPAQKFTCFSSVVYTTL